MISPIVQDLNNPVIKTEDTIVNSSDKSYAYSPRVDGTIRVYKFWAPWCGPCKGYTPIYDKVAAEFAVLDPEGYDFHEVNIDQCDTLANQSIVDFYKIRAVPTTIIVNGNGEMTFNKVGLLTAEVLRTAIFAAKGNIK